MHRLVGLLLLLFPLLVQSQLSMVELEVKRSLPEPRLKDSLVLQQMNSTSYYATVAAEVKETLYWTNYSRLSPPRFWDSVVAPFLKIYPSLVGPESASLEKDLKSTGSLPLFRLHPALLATAAAHARDIASKNAPPSHTSTDGTDFNARMRKAGIKHCAFENMAVGSHNILLSLVLLYLDIRLPTMGHRKALLNPNLTEIGIGYAPYGKDQFFMVQDMGCRQD